MNKGLTISFTFCLLTILAKPTEATSQQLRQIACPKLHDSSRVNQLNKKALYFIQRNQDSTLYYAIQAKSLSKELQYSKGRAEALLILSNYYNNKGDYNKAMEQVLAALKIFESFNHLSGAGRCYTQLAYVFKTMASQSRTPIYLNTGINYSKMAFNTFKKLNDTAAMANAYNVSGILYRDKYYAEKHAPNFDTAFQFYADAVQMIERSGQGTEYLGKLYNNISQVYNEYEKEYDTALMYLFRAVNFNKKRNNLLSLSHNYGNISYTYRKLKNYESALDYAQQMLLIAEELQQPNRKHDALYELFQIYEGKGDFQEAFWYYKQAAKITDSLSNAEKTTQVAELRTKYETERKELAIQQLHLEKELNRTRMYYLSGGLVLFILLTAALILLYRRVQLQKKRLSVQSQNLEVMMKELHHRVKNNLQIVSSLLSLQTYKLQDENTISVLRESQLRVQAMSLIHQRLYKTEHLTSVNMKEYLTDLAESVISSYGFQMEHFELNILVEKELLDVDKALPIGLIVNELITNALKYAYTNTGMPALTISLTNKEPHLILTVKDNGPGINEQEWKKTNSSFGKQLILALSKQLQANQNINTNAGTQFTFTIPNSKAA